MTAAALLDQLDGVIERGGSNWYAKCPVHADRNPSLSIRDTGERVLIYCFAGCSAETVLDSVGLTFRDLYASKWTAAQAAATANKGHKPVCLWRELLEEDRLVLEIAASDLESGRALTIEERARIELARRRLRAAQ